MLQLGRHQHQRRMDATSEALWKWRSQLSDTQASFRWMPSPAPCQDSASHKAAPQTVPEVVLETKQAARVRRLWLLSQIQPLDNRFVSRLFVLPQVVEQPSSLGNQCQQAPPTGMPSQMFGQSFDAL
jgi:hypothetical protein